MELVTHGGSGWRIEAMNFCLWRQGYRQFFVRALFLFTLISAALFVPEAKATPVTTIYEFLPEQSSVVWSGGIFGRRGTTSFEGQFQLTVDYDAGIASFDQVDATTSEPVLYFDEEADHRIRTQSLNVIFRMTELESTYVSDEQIDFLMERYHPQFPHEYSDIWVRLTFMDEMVRVTGRYVELIADGYQFDLDAVAIPEPMTLLFLGLGGLLIGRRAGALRSYQ